MRFKATHDFIGLSFFVVFLIFVENFPFLETFTHLVVLCKTLFESMTCLVHLHFIVLPIVDFTQECSCFFNDQRVIV